MVIDIHTHAFADNIAKNAILALEEEGHIKAVFDGTTSGLKTYMAQCGVDISVVQPVATKPSQVGAINRWAKESTEESLVCFGALHPDDLDILGVIAQLRSDGFKGVKLHPDYQRFLADEQRMMPIYRALAENDLVLMLHAGVDIGLFNLVHCTPLMISYILETVPELTMIAAHMGGHALWHDAEELLVGKNLYFDTSYAYYQLHREGMTRMIKNHGADKVLFGTDSPWRAVDAAIEQITSLDLPAADIDRIMYKNAQELLK